SVLQKTRQPFNANHLAQEAALAALADEEHQFQTKRITDEGRQFLQKSFDEMEIEYIPSYANFVLVKVGDGDKVFDALLRKGVIVRAMRSYKLPEWVRISIGTKEENHRCLELLKEVILG
ncbi:MAG: aminotransferase class I/II-fold pyridoxal phosphate-dependent enzyme, partial [Verrucomicrobiales bacterium]|nr:aminotransferase class I/II-fold pyridoxal phosphate-dependent enzyme [Verrucomicrobiales bacterium]